MDLLFGSTSATLWMIALATIFYCLYRWATRNFDYFVDQGIPGPKPVPIVGNLWGIWRRNRIEDDFQLTKQYGKTYGSFDGTNPNLVTSDAELVRLVLVKDSEHFINRRTFPVTSKYARKMIAFSRDQEWKSIRQCITPAFSTGKIKKMSPMIIDCCKEISDELLATFQSKGSIDSKKIFSKLTMDVVLKCAFGMKIENLDSEENDFMKNAAAVFGSNVGTSPAILVLAIAGVLSEMFGDQLFITKEFKYFFSVLENIINDRRESKRVYYDFIELTREAVSDMSKKGVDTFTNEDVDEIVIAQSVSFLLAGYDTTATTLTSSSFVLAKNPEIQEKLYNQIAEKIERHGGLCHEMIQDFPYLDQFIHEVLRMFAPVPRVERECNRDVTCNGIRIKKGVIVGVATYPLHYSDEYYTEPDKFDPDRWAVENKHNLNPYAYIPFGLGPRNCIGMRFAMEELKLALCTVVSRVKFVPVGQTPETMTFGNGLPTLGVLEPSSVILGVEER